MRKTKRLAVSGVLVAMAIVLSMIKVFELPFGGSITAFSMVPIMLAGFLYGVPWGLLCGLVDGVLQGVLGAATTQAFAGLSAGQTVAMACMDYLLAFSLLGCAGLLRKAMQKKPSLGFSLGALIAGCLRFLAHFASGAILWGSYAADFFAETNPFGWGETILRTFSGTSLALVYSAVYNGAYMLPEIVLSVIAAAALMQVKPLRAIAQQEQSVNTRTDK